MNKTWLGSAVLVIGLMLALFAFEYKSFLHTPLEIPASGLIYVVEEGASFHKISDDLATQNLGGARLFWQCMTRYETLASSIQQGEYFFSQGITPKKLLQIMNAGKVMQHRLTLVEGWTFRQLRQAIASHDALEQTLTDYSDEAIMTALGHDGEHAEGRFYPDTYAFPRNTSDLDFLSRAYQLMQQHSQQVWAQRPDDFLLKDRAELLTLASIIERETGLAAERPLIANVFLRRLKIGMRLQTDPTVIYGIGEKFDGNIRRSDLRTDTPYNTYTRHGLPPTPIAMPGLASMMAVIQPSDDKFLYFVAKGGGAHFFSETLVQHQQAVRKYLLTKHKGK